MKKLYRCLLLVAILITHYAVLMAQTGPAGIGNIAGTNGHPKHILWLRANDLSLTDGSSVTAWADSSGNLKNLGQSATINNPIYKANQINSLPVVRFAAGGADGKGSRLVLNPFSDFASDAATIFIVYKTTDTGDGLFSYAVAADNNNYLLFNNSNLNTYLAGSNNASGVAFNTGAFQILSNKWKSSGGNLNIFKDGTSVLSTTGFGTGSTITDDGSLAIGGEQDDVDNAYDNTQAFDGDIAEIIFYSSYLNNAQRTIVENYLNIKYAISIATDGFTAGHSSYNVHFTGIGQESDGSFSESVSSGLYIANNGSLENGDYIMWAHNGIANSVVMTDVAGDVEARWARDWYIEQIGAQNVSLKFDMPEGIGGQNPQNISNYVLLFRNATTGNYSEVNATIALGDADQVRFDVLASDLQNGYYTLGTKSETDSPLEGAPGKTWYTLVSGDWNNWETWTLDPSGALPNNPDHLYPQQVSDKVVIKSGKTVTMNLNSITCASLDVDGRLDLGITTGHGFNTISGNGRILMAADNFPTYSDISQFADEGQDNGTVVYYGASDYTLADAQTFYNMEVEVNTGVTVTLLNHLTLNGALTIKSGIFSLNNSAATSNLNITVKGDVLIVNGAKIITGTANARHQFNFYSDLTINGELNFTNRVAYDYNNEATNGIVDANFLSADADQSILCNGISNFYRIEIDKGTDATYILSIEATDASYFKLYGYANEGHADIAQLSANNNALGLVKGTVKIGANISIPVLTNASNYNVSEAAKLWVAGGTVLKNSGNSLVPYGTIELSAGLLEAKVSSGITTRSNGLISVSGGTLNVNQIRTSVFGASNVGGYAQSGGSVNLLGTNTTTDYYVFCLTYPGNVFSMTGGTLTVKGTVGLGSIFINSDQENIQVTGGTVVCETDNANDFIITSKAPFWNLIFRNTYSALSEFRLQEGVDVGSTDEDLAAQPLKVLNDFIMEGEETTPGVQDITLIAISSVANNNDVYVGGSWRMEIGARYTNRFNSGGGVWVYNTTYFNQTDGTSAIDSFYYEMSTYNGALTLGNVVMNRTSGNVLRLVSSSNRANSNILYDVYGDITVESGTIDQNRFTLRIWGTINNYDRLGTFYPNGSGTYPTATGTPDAAQVRFREDAAVTINTTDNAIFGNIRFNVATSTVVELNSDVYIERMEFMRGAIYIKDNLLKVDNMWNLRDANSFYVGTTTKSDTINVANSGVTGNRAIFSDGNASDGGLSLFVKQNTPTNITATTVDQNTAPITFPIGFTTDGGTTVYFRPAQMKVKNFVDSGYVNIKVVAGELQTTDLTGGEVLQHYWKTSYSDFTTLPTVAYRFYYRNQVGVTGVDLPSGSTDELTYVPGKVANSGAYNRDFESDPTLDITDVDESLELDANTRWIVFNGTSTGADFTQAGFVGFTLENSNYTAGESTRFIGNPQIFYVRANGNWRTDTTWSTTVGGSAASDYPKAGDIAVIRRLSVSYSGLVDITQSETCAAVIFNDENGFSSGCPRIIFNRDNSYAAYNSNFGVVEVADTHQGGALTGENHGAVIQYEVNDSYTSIFPNGDFGDFNNYLNALVIWKHEGSSALNLPISAKEYPQIWFDPPNNKTFIFPNTNVTVNGLTIITYGHTLMTNSAGGSVIFKKKLLIGHSFGSGYFKFPGTGTGASSVTVDGNIVLQQGSSALSLSTPTTGGLLHTLTAKSDITLANTSLINLTSANTKVNLILAGESNNSLTNTGSGSVSLYRIFMNKGTDQNFSFTFNDNFTLSGATSGVGVAKALELQNGTLILNDALINIALTSGNDNFEIPGTAGLQLNAGTATCTGGSGILLDGTLNINGGTLDMRGGDNYIQYSVTGNATIEVNAGNLFVGSQVRRSTTSTEGILHYSQTGGTAQFGINAAGQASRGIFEILNTGSSFDFSGGTFELVADYRTSPTTQSFYFNPETSNLASGMAVRFGNASTPINEIFTLYAGTTFPKIVVDNTSTNNPELRVDVVPLTVSEELEINAGAKFNANGLDLTLLGNFTNNGTFTANGNTTYLAGTSGQTLTGNTTFYNLISNCTSTVNQASDITVANELHFNSGAWQHAGYAIHAQGDVYSTIAVRSSSTGQGVIFEGTEQQQLIGTSTFDYLTTNNVNGVLIPTGYTVTISKALNMQSGIFDIGRNLLVIEKNAQFNQLSAFSESNMIQTNISFTDAGVKKYFPTIASSTEFIYPIGSNSKFTPIVFTITNSSVDNMPIRVKAADEIHPTITEDLETPDPEIVDASNVLDYYWILDSEGATNFSATAIMQALDADVNFTAPYDATYYITARLLSRSSGLFDKYTEVDFNESNNELSFSFINTNDDGIDGDYFAGVDGTSFNGAIPNEVPLYVSIADGVWTDNTIWSPVSPAGGPRGARVQVEHNVTIPSNYVVSYSTRIVDLGKLIVNSTFGHRLGNVTGTGTLYLERGDLPAGDYEHFFSLDSGTLEYGGSTNYDILSEISEINNLILSGTGHRRLPNINVQIHSDWTINGADAINEHDSKISIKGNLEFLAGTYDAGIGADAKLVFNGNTLQTISGPADFTSPNELYNFQISNASGVLCSTSIEISNELQLTSGIIYTSASNELIISNTSEASVIGGSSSSFIDGPMQKKINTVGTFDFPVGDNGRYGVIEVSNTSTIGAQYWEAEYHNYSASTDGYSTDDFDATLQYVYNDGYWRLKAPSSVTANVKIRWDSQTNAPVLSTDRDLLRLALWDNIADPTWIQAGATVTNTSQSLGYIQGNTLSFNEFSNGNYFAIGSDVVELDKTWTGATSVAWETSTNWSPSGVPGSEDNVIIPTSPSGARFPTISSQVQVRDMIINTSASVTVNATYSLSVNGSLQIASSATLLLKNTSSGHASLLTNGSFTNNGNNRMELYITANKFHYIGSPVSAQATNVFSTQYPKGSGTANPNWYKYDEAYSGSITDYAWSTPAEATMDVALGYAYGWENDYTHTLQGGSFNNGNITQAITKSGTKPANTWNLIANPYPSAINAADFINGNSSAVEGAIYMWDDDGSLGVGYSSSDYTTITQGGYTIGTGSGIIPNGLIAAGQAFFVKALSNSSVTFTNSMRRSGTGKFFKNGETMVEYPGVRLSVVTPLTGYNEVFVTYRSDATDAYDRLFDGEKLENSSSHIALYTFAANKKFAVNAFAPYGDSSIVALGVKTIDAGNHTFSLKELTAFDNEIEIYLRDKTTGTLTNLRTNSTYTVNLNAGEHNSRFELVIKNPEIETTEWKGMKSGSWSNASNWDNGVPTRYKNAKVTSGSVVVNSDMQFNDLIISGEAAVTINQNTQLNARGKVILEANGDKTGTLVDYDGSKEIKAVVKKGILANDRYYYLSSPLTNALTGVYGSTEELSGTNGMERKVYYWDGAWKRINNDGLQLTPMRGYIVKPTDMPNSLIEFDGILNTGLIEYELSKKGFQLIGNPYPSAIDWGFEATPTGWNDTDSLMATIWYRVGGTGGASGGGNFATYNRLSGFSTNGGTRYIPAMQAFWVKVVKPTVISVNNETRTAESTNFFKSSGTSIGFKLTASMNGLNDEAIVFSHINAKDIADDYDSEKYFVDGSASPQLYTTTVDDKLMAVNGFTQFAENQIITLGLRTAVNGTITLQLENLNGFENNTLRVLLVDRVMNNDTIDLSHLKSYTFESSAGDISDRFEIILGVKSTTSITPDEISGINIWGGYRIIGVSSENEQINRIDITDVSGRIVAQKLETTSSETLLTIDLPGVYLVRVYSNKGSMLRKIHVK